MQDWRQAALLVATAAATSAASGEAIAQDSLQGVVITGAASGAMPRNGGTAALALAQGQRVESPPGRCTEIVFSDGTSVVLEPGADFTRQSVERDPGTGRLVLRASAGRGRLRITTSDRVDVLLATPGAETRVVAASAVVQAGAGGSATLVSGGRVVVRGPGGREEVIRRPGFGTSFDRGGVQRQTPEEMAEAVAAFAPVERRQAVCRDAAGRRPAPAEPVVQVAQRQPATRPVPEERAFRQRNEGVAVPGGREGTGGAFQLAAAEFAAPGAFGSTLGAPRSNSATSSLQSTSVNPTPGSQEPELRIAGIEARQPLGSGRVRRFAPEAAGAAHDAPGRRTDNGVVTRAGATTVTGAEFRGLATGAEGSNALGSAYDASVRVGVVTLNVFSEPPFRLDPSRTNPDNLRRNVVETPRLSVSNSATPTATVFVRPGSDTGISDRTAFSIDWFDRVGGFDANQLDVRRFGIYVFSPTGRVVNGQTISTDEAFQDAILSALGETPFFGQGRVDIFRFVTEVERQAVYNGSAVFEVGLQSQPISPQGLRAASTPPEVYPRSTFRDGRVSRLPDGSGLLAYSGSEDLPALAVTGESIGFGPLRPALNPNRTGDTSEFGARFYVADVVATRADPVFKTRIEAGQIAEGERFLVIGGSAVAPPAQGMPGSAPGQVTRFAISDGLNPNGGFSAGSTIEAQFRGPGRVDQPVAFNSFNSFRPDETFAIRPGTLSDTPAGRGDSHLLVAAGNGGAPNVALRTELEVAADGRSSASVTAGGIAPRSASLVLSGSTVGAARLNTGEASLAITSSLGSLGTDEAGVGAHMFPSASNQNQVGYFAVGTQDIRRGVPGSDGGQPGQVEAVGEDARAPFTFTRLATNVGTPPSGVLPPGGVANLRGFAAGVVESVPARGGRPSLHGVSTRGLDGVAVDRAAGSNEFTARIDMAPRAAGELAVNPTAAPAPNGVTGTQALAFGGRDPGTGQPTTAWIGRGTFGAVSPGRAAMASVDADQLAGVNAGRSAVPPSNEHLAWGFFLGDLVNEANGARREHASLGFWVAGRPVDPGTLSTLTGTASYAGGMIGNVAEAGRVRTATGDFTQSWDFGARRGSMAANFDGRGYGVNAAMPAGANVFTGSGVSGDRRMVVQGSFFDAGPLAGAPAAVGGAFGVAGAGYGANGVFVGARR